MADTALSKDTTLSSEEALTRAVQFFSSSSWRVTSQSNRAVTLEGRAPIPWLLLFLTILAFMACIVPGVILYIAAVKKVRKFQNLVVTATSTNQGCTITITHPPQAKKLATKFLEALPILKL